MHLLGKRIGFYGTLLFFIEQACDPDFQVALEAYTAAENIENVRDEETLTRAILMIEDCRERTNEYFRRSRIKHSLEKNII